MKTKYIKDPKTGENILPITSPSAVIDENGTSINTRLTNDESKISSNITRITKVEHDIDNTYTKQEVDNLITTPNVKYENYQATTETSIDQILPAQGKSDTIYKIGSWDGTNTVVDTSVYSEYTWNGTIYKLLAVRSSFNDVFDISEATGNSYETLSAALTAANSIIPSGRKKGGISIKFVQSSDNKYVQYRLTARNFTTDTTQWQSLDTKKNIDSNGFINNTVGSISIYQRQSSVSKPFSNVGYAIGNGKMIESPNYACSDLLPVIDNIKIGVISNYNYAAVTFYKSDKSYLSIISFTTLGELGVFHEYTPQIPEDAAYFAVTTLKDEIVNSYVLFGNVEQYLDDKIDFPELMHTIYDSSLVREHKVYTDAGVGYDNTDYDAVKLNVSAGDVLRVNCNIGSGSNYHAVKFYTANGGTLVGTYLLDGDFIDAKLIVPDTATYAICQGRTTNGYGNVNHITLKVDLYAKYKVSEPVEDVFVEYDALMLEPCQGYYRTNLALSCSLNTSGYKVSVPIPVKVGDAITAGTTVSYPFDTIVHVTFDANKNILGTFNMINGKGSITQSMWDNGVRYIAVSFKQTDTPSLTVTRKADVEPFVLDKTLHMKISPYTNGFILWIPSKEIGGKYVGHRFIRYYKKWDSLEYEDADGNTQILTDVVNTDVWNCVEIYDENMNYIIQGNTNFIFAFDGQNHAGDGHGNEVVLFNQFIIDGKVKEITSGETFFGARRIFDLSSFECIWKSKVYRQGGGVSEAATATPYIKTDGTIELNAIHYLDAKFEYGNKIKINNSLEIKQDNVTFYGIYGAMLECNFGIFSYIQVNNDENTINQIADGGESSLVGGSTINLAPGQGGTGVTGIVVGGNEVKMWGKEFTVTQRMEPKYSQSSDKYNIYIHKYSNRLKAYLQPVKARGASAGEKEVFNSGDVFSVVTYREIEV